MDQLSAPSPESPNRLRSEATLLLLYEIKDGAVDPNVSLDRLFKIVVHGLCRLTDATRVSIYYPAEGGLELSTSTAFNQRRYLPGLSIPEDADKAGLSHLTIDVADLTLQSLSTTAALIAPIGNPEEPPIGYVIAELERPPSEPRTESELRTTIVQIAEELSLAIARRLKAGLEAFRWQVVADIFDNGMRPQFGFEIVCRGIASFVSSCRPFASLPKPTCEILLKRADEEYLTVVASTESGMTNRRVPSEYSVFGRFIANGRDLLFTSSSSSRAAELVARVDISEHMIAIIHLEYVDGHAVQGACIQGLRSAATTMTPILAGLQFRRERTALQQSALLATFDNHLENVTSHFSHDMSGPLATARILMDGIERTALGQSADSRQALIELRETLQQIDQYQHALVTDITGFSYNEPRRVARLMSDAIALVQLQRRGDILIREDVDGDATVYCSLFMKEVFVNVLANARFWVTQRLYEEPSYLGRIDIFIHREQRRTFRDDEWNPKIRITVRDNGTGMQSELLSSVFERNFTLRKSGTGFGLFAAKEYVTSIGGEISVDSVAGKYFEVSILLDEYRWERPRETAFGPPADPPARSASVAPGVAYTDSGAHRLLFVEDNVQAAKLYARALQQEGFDVDIAHSAEDALRLLSLSVYSVAVVDLNLSGIPNDHSGGESILRHANGLAGGTKFVVLSAEENPQLAADLIQDWGVARFVAKSTVTDNGLRALVDAIRKTL